MKTDGSERAVALPAGLVEVLRGHRALQRAEREAAGDRRQEHGLLLPTKIGTPVDRLGCTDACTAKNPRALASALARLHDPITGNVEEHMGAWDDGPFDNDSAADWCGDLHDADPPARPAMVRAALTTAALDTGYLDHDDAASAIAAAAIVASQMPGGEPITSPYAPDFLLAGESLDLDDDLPQLAVEALDRVLGHDSEWRSLWGEAGVSEFPQINKLRAVLSGPPELPGQIALL